MDIATLAPSQAHDRRFVERLSTYFRVSASPGAALALARMKQRSMYGRCCQR